MLQEIRVFWMQRMHVQKYKINGIAQKLVDLLLAFILSAAISACSEAAKTSLPATLQSTPSKTASTTPFLSQTPSPTIALDILVTTGVAVRQTTVSAYATVQAKTPSATPGLYLSPTPTASATPTPIPTPPGLSLMTDENQISYSEDHRWIWTGDGLNHITHIVSVDGKTERFVTLQPGVNEPPDPESYYEPVFKLPNSPYYYLEYRSCCWDPVTVGFLLAFPSRELVRLNLETGELSKQNNTGHHNSYLFSPKGKYLLYYDPFPEPEGNFNFHFNHLIDGQQTNIRILERYNTYGNPTWSLDNKQVILQSCYFDINGDMENEGCSLYGLILIDIENRSYKVLVPDLVQALNLPKSTQLKFDWFSTSEVLISRVDATDPKWLLNIPTGKVSPFPAYIGLSIPTLPEGITDEGYGEVFIEGDQSISLHLVSDRSRLMLWVSKTGTVSDVLVIPTLEKGEVISAQFCKINGGSDPYIIAISRLDKEAVMSRYITNNKITRVWHIDPATGILAAMPAGGIECSAEGGFDPNKVINQFLKGQ